MRQDDHVEILIGFDQRIYDQVGVIRRHIVVHGAMDQQQLTLEIWGICLIGLIFVV